MADNKNNNNNNGTPINQSVVVGRENRLIHSLQADNSNFVPPPVSNLSGNAANVTNNKNKNK